MSEALTLRREIDELLAGEQWPAARTALQRLWREESTPAAASFVVSRSEKLRHHMSMVELRLALVRTFTVEPLVPLLRAAAFMEEIDLTVRVGEFNTVAQELIDSGSALYKFEPHAVILASQTRDITPDLWERFADLDATTVTNEIERVVSTYRQWFTAFRSHSRASLLVHGLDLPPMPSAGALDSQIELGQTTAITQINLGVRSAARAHPGIYFFDYDAVVSNYGRSRWHDERRWLTTRLPMCPDAMRHLADAWLHYLQPLTQKVCKVLVTDLDNTLWGGVIGEDSPGTIQLGTDYPGAGYRALQRAMLDLHGRGVLLAVSSKNDEDDALEMLDKHPGMLLRRHHFSALRVNWNEKVLSLREIAAELNLGLDSLVFIDDNPVERGKVRLHLPEVTVIELPSNPMEYADALRRCPGFERLALSEEDRQRGRHYAQASLRNELRNQAGSLEDFFHSLEQKVSLGPVTQATVPRIAQLTQKTNQFNLTTRRYSEPEIAEQIARVGCRWWWLSVQDRFGDHGVVGAAMVRLDGSTAELDTFLLSCRVIGRTIETAFLSGLVGELSKLGVRHLIGRFQPTKKNTPAELFLPQHGFTRVSGPDANSVWRLDFDNSAPACPAWIQLRIDRP